MAGRRAPRGKEMRRSCRRSRCSSPCCRGQRRAASTGIAGHARPKTADGTCRADPLPDFTDTKKREKVERILVIRMPAQAAVEAQRRASKRSGGNPPQSGMRADCVIEDLQIGKNVCVRSCARGILLQVDEFAFQTAEEVLGNGIVVGIAPAVHALPDAIGFQSLPVGSGCVLNAAVTVENQARRRLPPVYPLARAAEVRLQQMIETVQTHGGVFFVQLHQLMFQRRIALFTLGRLA